MANVRCYVGNIPYSATELDLRSFFAPFELRDVYIITDRETGRPRGFAFVEPKDPNEVQQIISTFSGRTLNGRTVNVSLAHDKPNSGGGRRSAPSHVDRSGKNGGGRGHGRRDRYADDYND